MKYINRPTGLKKYPSIWDYFFDLFDSSWLGSWRTWLRSAIQTIGIVWLLIIITVSITCYILSKVLNACGQPLTSQCKLNRQRRPHSRLLQQGQDIQLHSAKTKGWRIFKCWDKPMAKCQRTLGEWLANEMVLRKLVKCLVQDSEAEVGH